MSDLIDRQAAIDAIWDGTNYDIYTREVKESLEQLPSAQPERKSFRNEKEMYQYILTNMLETYLERAKESLDDNAFTSLCLHICGFMAEYFT